MASNFMINVPEDFDVEAMAEQIVQTYQAKGFTVRMLNMKSGVKLTFDKNCGGINYLFGLGQGIAATCMLTGKDRDTLTVNFSDGDWVGKIVGCIVGWFFCLVPSITAVIGIFKQLSLPKKIEDDIQMIVAK